MKPSPEKSSGDTRVFISTDEEKSSERHDSLEPENTQDFASHIGYQLCHSYAVNTTHEGSSYSSQGTKSKSRRGRKRKIKEVITIDSDDEDVDDGSEAHVVCLACGHYNLKEESFNWICCVMCSNWYHTRCTSYWNRSKEEMEDLVFICSLCY